jgi:NAD+ kinase
LKKIGIITNKDKDIDFADTKVIIEKLLKQGFEIIADGEIKTRVSLPVTKSDNIVADSDFIICIGGDGTFLSVARKVHGSDIPVLGINKGTVGFLADVETRDIDMAISRISEGSFVIKPRMVLEAEVIRNEETVYKNIAVNDAVISRMALSRILKLKIMMDGRFVDSFQGDGVIISTPTGSTAYSLSAGGPIVQPDMRLMVITPICPHIMYSRSFIISEDRTVNVSIDDNGEIAAMLTLDGQGGIELKQGDLVTIKKSCKDVLFASVSQVNFYDVLRAKIHNQTG